MNNYKVNILRILNDASEPLDVEKIRKNADIGNWQTALKHLLELLIDRKIKGSKTSKSWVFWVEHSSSHLIPCLNEAEAPTKPDGSRSDIDSGYQK